jgi:hypothetical protein
MTDIKINDEMVSRIAFPLHVVGEILDSESDSFTSQQVAYIRRKFISQYFLDCSVGDDKLDNDVYINGLQEDLQAFFGCCL